MLDFLQVICPPRPFIGGTSEDDSTEAAISSKSYNFLKKGCKQDTFVNGALLLGCLRRLSSSHLSRSSWEVREGTSVCFLLRSFIKTPGHTDGRFGPLRTFQEREGSSGQDPPDATWIPTFKDWR